MAARSVKYRQAREQLLEDIVPKEDFNVKTSKFDFSVLTPYSLLIPNLLLLLLLVLLLHLLREVERGDQADVCEEVREMD